MSTLQTRLQFPELFQLSTDTRTELSDLHELTDYAFEEQPPEYADIYRVDDADTGSSETDFGLGGYGLPVQVDSEVAGLNYDVQGKWPTQTYVWVTFNKGYIVTHDIMADDKWSMAGSRAKWFGRSFRRLPEVLGARMFNEGFSTTTQGTIGNLGRRNTDGVALFSAVHPNPGPGGGTQANRPAALGGADLSHASLQAMMIRMGNLTDDRGMPVNIPMKILYVPWQLYPTALEITSSSFRTDQINRIRNVLADIMPVTPMKSHFLTNPRAYFGIGDKRFIGIRFIWRERFSREMWYDKETRAVHVGGWSRLDFGYTHWLGVDGDPGLGG